MFHDRWAEQALASDIRVFESFENITAQENRFILRLMGDLNGANVLHHVGDIRSFLNGVRKALKPGGRFFFYDPLAYNPAINVYRRLAMKVRTEGERPLRFSHLGVFKEMFTEVSHREFWLATLLIFFKYYLVDRVSPNEDRYWKRILREDPDRLGWWFEPLLRLDDILLRVPPFRYLAWNMVIWGRR